MRLLLGIALLVGSISGCSTPIKSIDRLPVASELRSASNPDQVVAHASKDIELLRAGRNPRYATFETALYDGGTCFFEGAGYRITDHRKIATRDGRKGFIRGQTIVFDREVTGGDRIQYSNATFIPSGE
jgi:hypothetical protein